MPARKEGQFCTCTAAKLYQYIVNARDMEYFCIGSKNDPVERKCSLSYDVKQGATKAARIRTLLLFSSG